MYQFTIELTIHSEQMNLIALLSVLQELWIAIDNITINKPQVDRYHITLLFDHHNPSKVSYMIGYIRKKYGNQIGIAYHIS
jgi:hypothetical protein